MQPFFLSLLCCVALLHACAGDEPLIPTALNGVLPKIHAGMTIPEVEAALAGAYPNVKGRLGEWSGQTGYVVYELGDHLALSVSSITRDGKEVVHDDLLFYLTNFADKHRVDIKSYFWEISSQQRTKFLGQ